MTNDQLRQLLKRRTGNVTISLSRDGCFLRDGMGSYALSTEQASMIFDALGFPDSAEMKVSASISETLK